MHWCPYCPPTVNGVLIRIAESRKGRFYKCTLCFRLFQLIGQKTFKAVWE